MSEPLNDGGPAFPCDTKAFQPHTGAQVTAQQFYGMSLRDWFAGQIAVGFAALPEEASQGDIDRLARYSFRLADAMLKARGVRDE